MIILLVRVGQSIKQCAAASYQPTVYGTSKLLRHGAPPLLCTKVIEAPAGLVDEAHDGAVSEVVGDMADPE